MKLIVLGNFGPYPGPNGEAVTSFVIETAKTKIVLDLGNGGMCNFARHHSWKELDAVILSHLHEDHIGDLNVLKYVKRYNQELNFRFILPAEPELGNVTPLKKEFYSENSHIVIGDMEIDFCQVVHPVPTYAMRIKGEGRVFVFSADSAYTEKLSDFAREADLFLCEAGVLDSQIERKKVHMSVNEGCKLARLADIKRVVFFHLLTNNSLEDYQKEVDLNSDLEVELAVENKTYEV